MWSASSFGKSVAILAQAILSQAILSQAILSQASMPTGDFDIAMMNPLVTLMLLTPGPGALGNPIVENHIGGAPSSSAQVLVAKHRGRGGG